MFYISDALNYYRSYRIRSLLLNQLLVEKEIPFDKIGLMMAEKMDKALLWKTFINDVSPELIFLIETGLASIDKQKGVVSITHNGVNALRNGVIEESTNSAFRNFVNIRLQITAIIISVILLLISMLSILSG